jgi:tetratricopeptide (TPR) repeat protein
MTKGKHAMKCVFQAAAILNPYLFAWSSPVAAGEAVDSAKLRAQATLREGNVALEHGHAEEALAKFTEAYRLFSSPKIHYNIGQAHSLILGHEAQASEAMLRFLIEAKDADASLRVAAEKLRTELKPKVGMVSVVAEPADADLLVDVLRLRRKCPSRPDGLLFHARCLRQLRLQLRRCGYPQVNESEYIVHSRELDRLWLRLVRV